MAPEKGCRKGATCACCCACCEKAKDIGAIPEASDVEVDEDAAADAGVTSMGAAALLVDRGKRGDFFSAEADEDALAELEEKVDAAGGGKRACD